MSMNQGHIRAVSPKSGGPTSKQQRLMRQREILGALRDLGPMSLDELAGRCELPVVYVRAELRYLRRVSAHISERDGLLYFNGERPRPVCESCGAILRRGHHGRFCDPCAASARNTQSNRQRGRGESRDFRERLLEVLRAHPGECVSPYIDLGLDVSDINARHMVGYHIKALRQAGHDIRGHRYTGRGAGRSGWSWHGEGDDSDA